MISIVLHFGNEVEECGEDAERIEQYFPKWCPKTYRELVHFCLDGAPDFGETFSIEWLKPCFAWIRQELGIQSKTFKFESPSSKRESKAKVSKTISERQAKRFSKKLQDSW